MTETGRLRVAVATPLSEELCDLVEARRERYGFSYWIIPDDAMEPFGPVVARLAGG